MDEYVGSAFALDETEALAGVEPLDSTNYAVTHCFILLTKKWNRICVACIQVVEIEDGT